MGWSGLGGVFLIPIRYGHPRHHDAAAPNYKLNGCTLRPALQREPTPCSLS